MNNCIFNGAFQAIPKRQELWCDFGKGFEITAIIPELLVSEFFRIKTPQYFHHYFCSGLKF